MIDCEKNVWIPLARFIDYTIAETSKPDDGTRQSSYKLLKLKIRVREIVSNIDSLPKSKIVFLAYFEDPTKLAVIYPSFVAVFVGVFRQTPVPISQSPMVSSRLSQNFDRWVLLKELRDDAITYVSPCQLWRFNKFCRSQHHSRLAKLAYAKASFIKVVNVM